MTPRVHGFARPRLDYGKAPCELPTKLPSSWYPCPRILQYLEPAI